MRDFGSLAGIAIVIIAYVISDPLARWIDRQDQCSVRVTAGIAPASEGTR